MAVAMLPSVSTKRNDLCGIFMPGYKIATNVPLNQQQTRAVRDILVSMNVYPSHSGAFEGSFRRAATAKDPVCVKITWAEVWPVR
jgi:hypothetical protein